MRPRALVAPLIAVLTGMLLAGCGGGAGDEPGLSGLTRDPVPRVASVRLPDVAPGADGRRSALVPARGDLLLVFFGYTSCPDVCPTTLGDIRSALRRLTRAERTRVEVAMVTVDPRRDTAAVLNGYLGHFLAAWRAYRTIDPAALAAAEGAVGASHAIRPGRDGKYSVVHSAYTYGVDDTGAVRVEWPFATRPRDMAADIRTLLGRASPPRRQGTDDEDIA